MAIRPPSRTTQLEDLPPEGQGPSPDELVAFDGESTDAFIARTGAPEPARLALTDAVPILRGDLEIVKGKSAGLFEVGEPATGRHFTLYEFELSIARMLDGRRHASDVIENGVRLGIPVDLEGLNKFIRQLWRYGFLAQPGTVPATAEGEEGGWGERVKWDEATRTLFQTGLRLMRQGRPQDAESYFHAVLDADPGNAEATELVAAIQRGEPLSASPIGSRPGRAGGARRRRSPTLPLVAAGVAALATGAVAFVLARQAPPARPAPPPPQVVQSAPPPPAPAWRTAAVQRRAHPSVGELAAVEEGIVLWKQRDGALVLLGERLGRLKIVKAGASLRTRSGVPRDVPLVAPAAGTLSLTAASRSRAARGAKLASIVDASAWAIEALLDGEAAAEGAACELRGDAVSERTPCALTSAQPVAGGSQLVVTVAAASAPWLEKSRSLRVRIAPPGTPPEPDPAMKREAP